MKYNLQNKVAVITGAGSGIGRAVARQLSALGCKIAIADVNEEGLRETASLLAEPPLIEVVDVAQRSAVERFSQNVIRRYGTAHIVINNAGVSLVQKVADLRYEDFEWLMGINFWGVVHGTTAFLPTLQKQNDGVIVNVSSVLGLVAMPTQSAYAAAKHAVRGFTDSLRLELAGSGVHAIGVYPGGVKTNIVHTARIYNPGGQAVESRDQHIRNFDRMAQMPAEKAASIIVNAIEHLKPRVLVGGDARIVDWLQRLMPIKAGVLMGKLNPKVEPEGDSGASGKAGAA